MKDVKDWLRGGDPLAGDAGLSAADVHRMRRLVLASAPARPAADWRARLQSLTHPRPLLLATAVVMAGLAAWVVVVVGNPSRAQRPEHAGADRGSSDQAAAPLASRHQLQFQTPGGTRIIWVFDGAAQEPREGMR